jgi:hypothetical protein
MSLCFLARPAVLLLEFPNQLLAVAGDLVPLIIGQFASARQGPALELGPASFDLIPS